MSIANYTELQTAIKNYVVKPNTLEDEQVRDGIRFTETKINNLLRTAAGETRVEATITGGDRYIPVPGTGDFGGVRNMRLTGDRGYWMEPMALAEMDVRYAETETGEPRFYIVTGNEIRLAPTPDAGYTAEFWYYKRVPALTDSEPTNWVLDGYPMIYLSGGIEQAWRFVGGQEGLANAADWGAQFLNEIAMLQAADKGDRWHAPRRAMHDYAVR